MRTTQKKPDQLYERKPVASYLGSDIRKLRTQTTAKQTLNTRQRFRIGGYFELIVLGQGKATNAPFVQTIPRISRGKIHSPLLFSGESLQKYD